MSKLTTEWWGILSIVLVAVAVVFVLSVLFYRPFFKRFYDIVLSGLAILVLSPVLLILTVLGAIKMKGNPFFTQLRPGKKEKIFRLVKFRTMTCEKDAEGNLLPDEKRLTKYGKILRSTSLDELPELFNIFVGHMSIVGPRPLLVEYLPYYTDEERQRHNVRPGLTGLAQVNGRNAITWEEKFAFDVQYARRPSLFLDAKIILQTVLKVLKRSDILVGSQHKVGKLNVERQKEAMNVSIRKFEEKDIANKVKWINDETVNQFLHYDLPLEYEKTKKWYERIKDSKERFDAVIEADGVPVGLIGLLSIDSKNKKAEFYVCMGEQSYAGKGIAKKASRLLMQKAFDEFELNRLYLYTEEGNKRAQELFVRLGFKREGLLQQDLIYNGKSVNRYLFAVLNSEYNEIRKYDIAKTK